MSEAATIRALREEIETLREENRQFKALLAPRRDGPIAGLTPQESAMLRLMARGGWWNRDAIMDAWRLMGWEPEHDKIVTSLVMRVRRKLGSRGVVIENSYGAGYRIAPDKLEAVRALIAEAA